MTESSGVYDGTHYRSDSNGENSERYQVHILPMQDYTFLKFLSAAQSLVVDFVPIIWQSILKFNEEGRAEVRGSLMTVQLSFAFKCVKRKERCPESERRQNYRKLIAEIRVSALATRMDHAYLARLEDISWDIASHGEVWPVLMFEKTKHGSLKKFVASKE